MPYQWLFLSNVFRLLAERSLERFSKFCYTFMGRLMMSTSDPFFEEKHQQLLPYYDAFNKAYDQKSGNKALRKGDTKQVNQLLKQLVTDKLHAWDIAIQSKYLKSTAIYTYIFPQGLSPFSSASIEQRIKYLGNAVTMLSNYADLVAVYEEMKQFHTDLQKARDNKTQKDGNVNNSIEEAMLAAYDLADEMYGVLGEFMGKFKKNPSQIEAFFPVFLLRQKRKNNDDPNDVLSIIIPKADKTEGGFSFKISDSLNFYVCGETELEIYFVPDKNAAKPANVIKLLPQDVKTILIKDYANQNDRFMMIENLSATEEGELEVSMV